jgi:hypothetical protein
MYYGAFELFSDFQITQFDRGILILCLSESYCLKLEFAHVFELAEQDSLFTAFG